LEIDQKEDKGACFPTNKSVTLNMRSKQANLQYNKNKNKLCLPLELQRKQQLKAFKELRA
jgi:hypothetical protein